MGIIREFFDTRHVSARVFVLSAIIAVLMMGMVGCASAEVTPAPILPSDLLVSNPGENTQLYKDVAFDGTNYFVVWESPQGSTNGFKITGRFISPAGDFVGEPVVIIPRYGMSDVKIAWNGLNYLIVYQNLVGSGPLSGKIVTKTGTLGPEFTITPYLGNYFGFDICSNGTGFLVTWSGSNTPDIYGQRISSDGALIGENFRISPEEKIQMRPSVTTDGRDYFVIWREDPVLNANIYDIYGARVTAEGVVLDNPPITISNAPGIQSDPKVMYGNGKFLAAWATGNSIHAMRISNTGSLLDGPSENDGFVVSAVGSSPSLGFDGTNWLVTFRDSSLKAIRVSQDGIIIDPLPPQISWGNDPYNPEMAFDGSNYMVAWAKSLSTFPYSNIYCQIVTPSNLVPVAIAGEDFTIPLGTSGTLDGSLSYDPDNNLPLSYSWKVLSYPQGSTFQWITDTSAQPAINPDLIGDYTIQLTVTDSRMTPSASDKVIVTVAEVNNPPVLAPIGDRTVVKGDTLSFTLSATDADGDSLTYSADNLPTGSSFDPSTHMFAWTPDTYQLGSYYPVFRVTDSIDEAIETVQITIQDPNAFPFAITTNQFVDTVSTVDLSLNPELVTVLGSVTDQPMDVEVSPEYTRALVSTIDSGEVVFFDLTQNPVVETSRLAIGGNAAQIAITPDGKKAVVGNSGNTLLSILDISGTTPVLLETVAFPDNPYANPYGVAITNDGRYALVATNSNPGKVYVVDIQALPASVEYSLDVAKYSEFIGLDPTGHFAIVTMYDQSGLTTIIDLTTNPFSVKGILPVGKNPGSEPAISPDGHYALVANADDDTVSVIDLTLATPAVVQTITVGDDPRGVGIIGSDNVALVANRGPAGGSLTKIDLDSLTVIDTITGLSTPNHVSVYYKVKLNQAPVLTSIGSQSVNEGELLSFTISGSDPDTGDTLTYSATNIPAWASFDAATGTFSGTPGFSDAGSATVTFAVTDGTGSDSEDVVITVNNVNQAPILDPIGNQNVNEEQLLSFTATATDPDGQTLTFTLTGAPEGAAITSDGIFTWTPTETQGPGSYPFEVIVSDGILTDSESITVTVAEVNQAPILDPIGNHNVDEEQLLTFTATATDPDGQTLIFSLVGAPEGTVIDPASGAYSWTPTETQGPGSYTFDIVVSDGILTDSETITITVAEVNQAPILGSIGNQNVNEGQLLSFTVSGSDADGDTLTYTTDPLPTGATFTGSSFTWIPGLDQAGTYTVTFTVTDGTASDSEDVVITVNNINQAPVLDLIGSQSVDEGQLLSFVISATDPDGDSLTYAADPLPTGATFSESSFTWTPGLDQSGTYTVTFTVTDSNGSSDSEEVTITVNNVNQVPVLDLIGSQSVDEGQLLSFVISATDPDGDSLTYAADPLPTGATFSESSFTWTPGLDQSGTYTVTFTVTDSNGASDSEEVTITVNNVNQDPVLDPIGSQSVNEGEPLSFTVSGSDADGDTLTYSATNVPAWASFDAGSQTISGTPGFSDAGSVTITFTVTDGTARDSEDVVITVNNVNQAPVLDSIGNKNVDEEQLLTFTATATDSDAPTQTLSFSLGATAPIGSAMTSDGVFTWTPTEIQGPGSYTFDIVVSDGILTDAEAITVTVAEVNQVPILGSIGAQNVNEGQLLSFTVSASDADGDSLTYTADPLPTGATFSGSSFTWSPGLDQSGAYTVTFTVTDSNGASDSEEVTVTVNNVNQVPVLGLIGSQSVNEGEPLSFTVSGSDADGGTLTYSATNVPAWASFNAGSQTFSGTPGFSDAGSVTITFTVTDGTASDSEDVVITVNNVNQAPVLDLIGSKSVNEGELLSFTVTATDLDTGDTITYTADPLPAGATFSGSSFTWTPGLDQAGAYTVTFTVTDGTASDSEDVVITVNNVEVNHPPVLSPIGDRTIAEGSTLTIDIIASDEDGDPLTFTADPLPAGATFSGSSFTWTPGLDQAGTYTVTFAISDGTDSIIEDVIIIVTETITDGLAPTIQNILASPNPAAINTVVTLTATVDDAGTGNSAIGSVLYSTDGSTWTAMTASDGAFDEVVEDVTATLPMYSIADILSITIKATDAYGNTAISEPVLLAIYDPNGAFITAGGWFTSPAGAYKADPAITGKANLGLNSKYKKGTSIPTGETEFHLKEADLKFKSTSYDWMVINGAKATYRGSGTVNGAGNYGFLVSAIAGEISGGKDLIRFKIWDKATNTVIYDNGAGSDSSNPITPLGGGNIKIHA